MGPSIPSFSLFIHIFPFFLTSYVFLPGSDLLTAARPWCHSFLFSIGRHRVSGNLVPVWFHRLVTTRKSFYHSESQHLPLKNKDNSSGDFTGLTQGQMCAKGLTQSLAQYKRSINTRYYCRGAALIASPPGQAAARAGQAASSEPAPRWRGLAPPPLSRLPPLGCVAPRGFRAPPVGAQGESGASEWRAARGWAGVGRRRGSALGFGNRAQG